MVSLSNVVIVGAGPYGLSIAAHLHANQIGYRIFGNPMLSWREHSPKGMRLKSEGFASNLSAPKGAFPLSEYCAERQIPYADVGVPISAETFVDYGQEFQRRYVPDVEERQVIRLQKIGDIFRLWLDNGECAEAHKVVLGTGLGHYTRIPTVLKDLPQSALSHSWHCSDLDQFANRRVVVVGAGASALDCAATLLQGKASVDLVTRQDVIAFQSPPSGARRSLRERVRWPQTGLGPGWKSTLSTRGPLLIHRLPERLRHEFVRSHLGPAPGWFVRDQVMDHVQFHKGQNLESAEMRGDRVFLQTRHADGERRIIEADHVVAATGYEIDLRRVPFLSPDLLAQLRVEDHKPALSVNLESSVSGLYIVGPAAAYSLGPLLRFAYGAHFSATRVSRHLAQFRAKPQRAWTQTDSRAQASAVKI